MVREVFTCLRCEQCCYFTSDEQGPLVFADERARLEELARLRGFSLTFREVKVGGATMYRWVIRGFCPFYDRASRSCTIHGVKPLACKMYPLLYNPKTGEVLISRDCPWVDERVRRGVRLSLRNFPNEYRALKEVISRLSNGSVGR